MIPALSNELRRSLGSRKFKRVSPDKATRLRIHQDTDSGVIYVYPMFFTGRWNVFFRNDKPLCSKIVPMRINGVEIGDSTRIQANKLRKLWTIWLLDWIKSNGSRAFIERPQKKINKKKQSEKSAVSKFCYLCDKHTKHYIVRGKYVCAFCETSRAPRIPMSSRDQLDVSEHPLTPQDS